MRKGLLTDICGGALLGAALLAPGSASAAVTCANGGTDTLTITITAGSTQVSVDRSGTAIRAFDGAIGAGTDPCSLIGVPPTVTNTNTINISDTTGGSTVALISLQGGRFEPGMTAEPTGASEIEISYGGGGTGNDRIELDGSDSTDDLDLGEGAATTFNANVNPASEAAVPDCDDVIATNTQGVVVRGRGGDDDVNATSCNGIGGATPLDPGSLSLEGGNNKDAVRGGPGADSVLGGSADDNVNGGSGDDSVDGQTDDDKVDGGVGADVIEGGSETDRVLYDDRTTPLTATIGGGADDGGAEDASGGVRDNIGFSVEHFTGGSAGDTVTGSSVRNVLNGGLGDDNLLGEDGNDDVEGEGGNDTVDGGDGKDNLRGQDGQDTGRGGSGADDIRGGDSADKLFGGSGADFIKGDKGKDSMSGQGGNDKIAAKDKKKDKKISCGKGKAKKESATVDKSDPNAKSC
jgi:Ca2+-binding RTX toxin-like protein